MRENRRGEMALRVARRRAKRQGDTELLSRLDRILAYPERAEIAGAILEDEVGKKGGLFRDILSWIVENPQQFKDLITFIIGLFSGVAFIESSTAQTFGSGDPMSPIARIKAAFDDLGKIIGDEFPVPAAPLHSSPH